MGGEKLVHPHIADNYSWEISGLGSYKKETEILDGQTYPHSVIKVSFYPHSPFRPTLHSRSPVLDSPT